MAIWNKLVRDRIPEIIEADNKVALTRTLAAEDFASALHVKLREEADELKDASVREDIISETADILEVLFSLCDLHGIEWDEIMSRQISKRLERGAFSKRIFLIETRSRT